MPVYLYECTKGHRFEVTQEINDTPITKCQRDITVAVKTYEAEVHNHCKFQCGEPCERIPNFKGMFNLKGEGFFKEGLS